MTDLLFAMWYSPVLFIAVLLVFVVGIVLGLTALVWLLEKLRGFKRRRAFKAQQKRMAADFDATRTAVQDRLFGGLRAEDMQFDIPGMEPRWPSERR
ncbi:hypothetical protein MYRNA_59 [Mycobacterium phage Myrna]|uniref:Uncharacterized protein n=1 Tax=Mycobacterium phage Myrna TaxID=546805 RepID=B5LJ70_9CAUD|nr:gp59 [Mycobacterium phage Myrna]ACH62067.1 hypothetical protein MYRNA_59 [Mycobacterium phage Myrna]